MKEQTNISLLGSTGSIGTQTVDVAQKLGLHVCCITANRSVDSMEAQARLLKPDIAVMYDEASAAILKTKLADTGVKVYSGMNGLKTAAAYEKADTVVTAVVGMIGLEPTMEAIRTKKRIALANKETLVCAGSIVMQSAKECGAEIIPVDSEHSAIFQSMDNKAGTCPEEILLTASGGPFRGKTYNEIKNMPPEAALKHPNWNMGAKVTIDSATMMNKGLELIEAMHLFQMAPEKIEILVHPQSIVHSGVKYQDGSVIAQLGVPDMRLPIQYALTYPERFPSPVKTLSLAEIASLTFEKPDLETFRCLALAKRTAKRGTAQCAAMNAANEIAVGLYLRKDVSFGGIYETVNASVNKFADAVCATLDDVLELDKEVRAYTLENYIN